MSDRPQPFPKAKLNWHVPSVVAIGLRVAHLHREAPDPRKVFEVGVVKCSDLESRRPLDHAAAMMKTSLPYHNCVCCLDKVFLCPYLAKMNDNDLDRAIVAFSKESDPSRKRRLFAKIVKQYMAPAVEHYIDVASDQNPDPEQIKKASREVHALLRLLRPHMQTDVTELLKRLYSNVFLPYAKEAKQLEATTSTQQDGASKQRLNALQTMLKAPLANNMFPTWVNFYRPRGPKKRRKFRFSGEFRVTEGMLSPTTKQRRVKRKTRGYDPNSWLHYEPSLDNIPENSNVELLSMFDQIKEWYKAFGRQAPKDQHDLLMTDARMWLQEFHREHRDQQLPPPDALQSRTYHNRYRRYIMTTLLKLAQWRTQLRAPQPPLFADDDEWAIYMSLNYPAVWTMLQEGTQPRTEAWGPLLKALTNIHRHLVG